MGTLYLLAFAAKRDKKEHRLRMLAGHHMLQSTRQIPDRQYPADVRMLTLYNE